MFNNDVRTINYSYYINFTKHLLIENVKFVEK